MKKIIFVLMVLLVFAGCKVNNMENEYNGIIQSGKTGEQLLAALSDFEVRNSDHFASKIDLAGYYMLSGNYEQAKNYLLRAESLIPDVKRKKSQKQNIIILYGSLSYLYLLEQDFSPAESYARKAIDYDVDLGKEYTYLLAQIMYAQGRSDDALQLFDEVYQFLPDKISNDDIKTYVYLLSEKKRYADASKLLDVFFSRNVYFPGLGLFASSVYENNEETEKSILCAYIDYEYYTGYQHINSNDFLANLDRLQKKLTDTNTLGKGIAAIQLIRCSIDGSSIPPDLAVSDFFVAKYLMLKMKLLSGTYTAGEFDEYLQMEPFFSSFPVYYWNVWFAVSGLPVESRKGYTSLLEKILSLSGSGSYSNQARLALGNMIGLSDQDSEKILVPYEVTAVLQAYLNNPDEMLLEPVFDLLELPDNTYVYQTISLLKEQVSNPVLRKAVQEKGTTASGRMKERIDYILY